MPSAARVVQTAAYRRARDLRFLAELGNGQPLALGVKALRTSSPRARDSIKVRVVLGLPGAQRIGDIVAHRILLRCSVKLTADHYTLRKMGRAELCRFYHHDHINNRLLTNASIIAQHFDYRR